ncbi:sterol desaturase family protein [Mesorhizobium sp. B2-4-12]|uniref:sterol desaturase family protein n=1 Tax=Mesorhizobium sp. B2-4-12 TaxID=2589937 RepID=UPI00112B95BF|nr:sterol desaturase family protein [Mesorhizobium sp. B2-4-12]TPK93581.1 sterol desaturase family protein [Mesorhizobium sp. B2-4-12]
MDDLQYGTRDKRGNWAPHLRAAPAPIWHRPFNAKKVLAWIPEFFWPWNTFHLATSLIWVNLLIPSWQSLASLSLLNYLWLYGLNAAGIFLFYGFFELRYYVQRKQQNRFKYNPKFPSDAPSDVFWFQSQNIDNFARSFFVTIPLWTVVEIVMLWVYANSWAVWLPWTTNWLYLSFLVLIAPAVHEVYFFFLHRAIHWPPLYKWVHSVHHNSINPSPWSSLSMHPVEGFLYHAEAWLHLLIPSNPVCAYFTLHGAGFGAVNGHLGFETFEITDKINLDSHSYVHYLHHKYFEVNYGGDGLVPLDKLFGTWHDGSKEADEVMKTRFRKKKEKVRSRQEGRGDPASGMPAE